jgi:hypothetical protein
VDLLNQGLYAIRLVAERLTNGPFAAFNCSSL